MTIRDLINDGIDIDAHFSLKLVICNLDTEDDISCCIDDVNWSIGEDESEEEVPINIEICLRDLPQ